MAMTAGEGDKGRRARAPTPTRTPTRTSASRERASVKCRSTASGRRELEALSSEKAFEDAIAREGVIVIDFMASWCRKCVFLKAKLEKLSAAYDVEDVRFCTVDVNKVPQQLIRRVEVVSMPTLQVYVKGEKVFELVGGEDGDAVARKMVYAIEDAQKKVASSTKGAR